MCKYERKHFVSMYMYIHTYICGVDIWPDVAGELPLKERVVYKMYICIYDMYPAQVSVSVQMYSSSALPL